LTGRNRIGGIPINKLGVDFYSSNPVTQRLHETMWHKKSLMKNHKALTNLAPPDGLELPT